MPPVKKRIITELPIPEYPYCTSKELADFSGIHMQILTSWQRKGNTPQYAAVSCRSYRYPKEEFFADTLRKGQERTGCAPLPQQPKITTCNIKKGYSDDY